MVFTFNFHPVYAEALSREEPYVPEPPKTEDVPMSEAIGSLSLLGKRRFDAIE